MVDQNGSRSHVDGSAFAETIMRRSAYEIALAGATEGYSFPIRNGCFSATVTLSELPAEEPQGEDCVRRYIYGTLSGIVLDPGILQDEYPDIVEGAGIILKEILPGEEEEWLQPGPYRNRKPMFQILDIRRLEN